MRSYANGQLVVGANATAAVHMLEKRGARTGGEIFWLRKGWVWGRTCGPGSVTNRKRGDRVSFDFSGGWVRMATGACPFPSASPSPSSRLPLLSSFKAFVSILHHAAPSSLQNMRLIPAGGLPKSRRTDLYRLSGASPIHDNARLRRGAMDHPQPETRLPIATTNCQQPTATSRDKGTTAQPHSLSERSLDGWVVVNGVSGGVMVVMVMVMAAGHPLEPGLGKKHSLIPTRSTSAHRATTKRQLNK